MKKAIFLDRDGTINVEKNYLYKIEEFEFEKGSLEAIKIFTELGYEIIIVTNQSGIAREYFSENDFKKLNDYMVKKIKEYGGKVTNTYYCPHHEEKGIGIYKKKCSCRKPESGMLLKAIEEYKINKELSYMVGDKMTDIKAGLDIGIASILVKTGYGENKIEDKNKHLKFKTFENLFEFAIYLKKNCK
ncbi:MAG: D-glycero-beta-D-manno-heptose 1,7-bisphosphate 7-phosphatase [Fusobacteriaceae bacterium]